MKKSDFYNFFKISCQIKRLLCALCMSCILYPAVNNAAAEVPTVEYQVKASLIFNFLHFVTWPENTFSEQERHITICLFGRDLYGNALQILSGQIIEEKVIEIQKIDESLPANKSSLCHVKVFTSRNHNTIQKHLSAEKNKAVLTIGESDRFLQQGGIIKFTIVEDTVQFEINYALAEMSNITISSKLLRLAKKVIDKPLHAD